MLSKTTEYAIRSLIYIYIQNLDGKRPGYKEIAKEINSPEQFTAKVLQNLARAELISSMKGRGGGFFFADLSVPVNLHEIVRIIEGEMFFSKCGFGLEDCNCETPCPLHEEYSPVRDGFYQLTKTNTIQSLAGKVNDHKAVLIRI